MQTEGIVLRTFPSREADLVLRVMTTNHGKLALLAKHARKSKKRFVTSFDVFDYGVFELPDRDSELLPIKSFTARYGYPALRSDLDKISAASLLCECVDILAKDDSQDSLEIFETLQLGLQAISEAADLKEALKALHLTLFQLLVVFGFVDGSRKSAPSVKNLRKLINATEDCCERALLSKPMLIQTIDRISA